MPCVSLYYISAKGPEGPCALLVYCNVLLQQSIKLYPYYKKQGLSRQSRHLLIKAQ
jgi:hypothetical protein